MAQASPLPLKIVVLISGRGSNLQAILTAVDKGLPVQVAAVISNRPDAPGLELAVKAGVATEVVDHGQFQDRTQFDHALSTTVDRYEPDLVVLAGFMRVLTEAFVTRYSGRMINIHPSLLPAFRGLNTHARALAAGETAHGASVHFVTAELDGGPVILQGEVPIYPDDSATTLAKRVLEQEHRILPLAIGWFAGKRMTLRGNTVWFDGEPLDVPHRLTYEEE